MLKFVKGNLENIDGVSIYPVISLIIFFTILVLLVVYVFTSKKEHIDTMSNLPFEEEEIKNNTTEQ